MTVRVRVEVKVGTIMQVKLQISFNNATSRKGFFKEIHIPDIMTILIEYCTRRES